MGLMDRLFAPVRECIGFPDLLMGLSGINNEPLSDVIYYLSCCDFELLNTYRIDMSHKVELIENSQDLIHYFLEDASVNLPASAGKWVFTGSIDNLRLLPVEVATELVGIFDAHADYYFKISELLSFAPLEGYLGFLESKTAGEEVTSSQVNNSLASYMTEYTLPQVVALILHIDLADITTSPNNSYINDKDKYGENSYQKFENLLQSYSVAALNNKLHGVNLHTRTVTTFSGGTETHIDLEKTTISRGELASYLDSIGYQLDDLIAKQDPVHTQCSQYADYQQDESELTLSLQQQVAELQSRLDEKDKELEANSKELDKALNKVKHLSNTSKEDNQLSDNTANDYQVTIGMLLELLRTPKGFDKAGKPNDPLFRTQNAIIEAVTDEMLPNHAGTKVSGRFTASNAALNKAKKKRDSDLDHKAALAEKLKRKVVQTD